MLEQKGILIHEISFKSLSTPQQPTSNPPLFPPPKKKKEPSKPHRPTIKPSKVLLSQSQNSRFSQLLSRGQPVPKEREKENKKKKKEKKKNDDEERDACLANN